MNGMADTGDAGSFSDDELDALASDDLLALEDQAVQQLPDSTLLHQNGLPELQRAPDRLRTTNEHHKCRNPVYQDLAVEGEVEEAPLTNIRTLQFSAEPRYLPSVKPTDEVPEREQWRLNRFGAQRASPSQAQIRNGTALPHRSNGAVRQSSSQAIQLAPQPQVNPDIRNSRPDVERLQAELHQASKSVMFEGIALMVLIASY